MTAITERDQLEIGYRETTRGSRNTLNPQLPHALGTSVVHSQCSRVRVELDRGRLSIAQPIELLGFRRRILNGEL